MAYQITNPMIVYPTVYSTCRSKKTSKFRVTGRCQGNSPVTGEFPAQRASNAENVSIWWRNHVKSLSCSNQLIKKDQDRENSTYCHIYANMWYISFGSYDTTVNCNTILQKLFLDMTIKFEMPFWWICGAATDKNYVKMTFAFQCRRTWAQAKNKECLLKWHWNEVSAMLNNFLKQQECEIHAAWIHGHISLLITTQIAKFMGPTWGPPGSCGPRWAPYRPNEPCYEG